MEEVAHVPLAALVREQDEDAKALQKAAAVRKRLLDVAWVEEAERAFGRNEIAHTAPWPKSHVACEWAYSFALSLPSVSSEMPW